MNKEEVFLLGTISKTKGLKGEIQLYIQAENADAYTKLGSVFLEISGKLIPFFVQKFSNPQQGTAILHLDELDSIEKASAIVGRKVFLPLKEKKAPSEEQQFINNLVGFMIHDETHGELGSIEEVLQLPQQLIARITYKEKEVLIPINEHIVRETDSKSKTLLVSLPDGLLDIYLQ